MTSLRQPRCLRSQRGVVGIQYAILRAMISWTDGDHKWRASVKFSMPNTH